MAKAKEKKKKETSSKKTIKKSVKKSSKENLIEDSKISGKSLVIVESPGKVKTISKFLGKNFFVKASIGHVRDLPSKGLGVDVKNNFEPTYEIMEDKEKVVKELKDLAKKSSTIYLAQDPDREGEAIAWHLQELFAAPNKTKRIVCNEITKDAIKEAIKHPRQIDGDLVNAQQARRILDRLVGYKISPLLWRKVGGRSAGRVQSVALRLVIEREQEIKGFVKEEYWSIHAELEKDNIPFRVKLHKWQDKTISSPKNKETKNSTILRNAEEVNEIIKELKKSNFIVSSIEIKESYRNPQAPFITSTLQRACANHLGFTVKKIMKIAQELYEGLDIGEEGPVGLITYMRTDSTRISKEAQDESHSYIIKNYGEKYYPDKPRTFSQSNKKNVQDAHEAIRPTSAFRNPTSIHKYLSPEQFKVYKIIWERFIASQMSQAKFQINTIDIEAGKGLFRTNATTILFDGFLKAYENQETQFEDIQEKDDDGNITKLPDLKVKDKINLVELDPKQHFTEPPPRYNEASLVKKLEELGIGRPSTYASTISTIVDRKYVHKLDTKVLQPTFLGEKVTELLVNHFPKYLDYDFTAQMESKLDDVEEAKLEWHSMIGNFYDGFSETLKTAQEELKTSFFKSDHKCPKCGNDLVIKGGRFGPFLGCSNYPECKTIVNIKSDGSPREEDKKTDEKCTKCNTEMILKHGPYGQYLQCMNEECKNRTTFMKKTGVKCPKEGCGGEIIEKRSRKGKIFFGCSNWSQNKCNSVFWNRPILEECPDCKSTLTFKQTAKATEIVCPDIKECGYKRQASEEDITKYSPNKQAQSVV